ncbi:MAG: short-chain fatty acid transporter [Crocinitomicaceae bacterium]|nr:short-chain fatty acid transporter [Crocinitomicaceae bacterium]
MKIISLIEKAFKSLMPSPFSIALVLTAITFTLAWAFTDSNVSGLDRGGQILGYWSDGLWVEKNLAFAVQMMLMLVLGHALALTKPVDGFIGYVTQFCTTTANSAALVTLLTVLVSLFNWGLGLIFGAILARKVGEHAAKKGIKLNYALIGAAGYSGLMVWHGGISGTAPLKAAEKDSITTMMEDVVDPSVLAEYPSSISMDQTIFSPMNLTVMLMLVVLLPAFMYWLGKRSKKESMLPNVELKADEKEALAEGADRLDVSRIFSLTFGLIIFNYASYLFYKGVTGEQGLGVINPNFINILLLGLCLSIHKSVRAFLKAIDAAIGGASGILIQFPLYFGIIGIMTSSGLANEFSGFFVTISNGTTYPIFTLFSAGIVNIFVPSGGGQWAVQGPIILQAAHDLGLSLPKSVMALSYGDQITNMLQPFWALPLLGITGLKAKSILPYTIALMGVGIVIFVIVLLLF